MTSSRTSIANLACWLMTAGVATLAGEPVSFVNDVQPILTKLGCNQGACHGAQYGQGGFKLSLRAFDDNADYTELIRGAYGRRIKGSTPEESLLLTKPLMDVPHGGGRRIKKDLWAFQTLVAWLKQNAPGPVATDRKLKQVVVTPGEAILQSGQTAQVSAKAVYEDGFEEPIERKASFDSMNASVIYVNDTGEVGHPRTGAILPPKPLGAAPADDPVDRRRALAAWLADKSNPAYARNLANRYWGYYFGRGLASPIDDMRVTDPAANSELLDALTRDLIAHNYDVKHLMRTIMRSHIYQLNSITAPFPLGEGGRRPGEGPAAKPPANSTDPHTNPPTHPDGDYRYVTHFSPTRLKAEQLLDAVDFSCGTQEKFPEVPLGFRAIALPDSNFPNEFLDAFGRPRRVITCECERSDTPNMTQALLLIRGDLINRKVADGNGRIAKLVKANTPADQIVDELFLCSLSRMPTPDEKQAALAEIATASSPQEGYKDFLWTLLNTREFQFNH